MQNFGGQKKYIMGAVQMANCPNIRIIMNNYEKILCDCRFDIKRIACFEFKISNISKITLVFETTTS